MILREMEHLERETKEAIEKAQRDRNTWAISDERYDEIYNHIMDWFRFRTAMILDGRSRREYADLFITNLPK
jgi:hypothetical protein